VNLPVYLHLATDRGRERAHNEDAVEIAPLLGGGHVLVVCDGMGGQEAGDIASKVAIQSITEAMRQAAPPWYEAIYHSFERAQESVVSVAAQRNTPTMGTTAVCAVIDGAQAWVGWIGDSRLYLFRGGQVIEHTDDHTRVREMVEKGLVAPGQAKSHPDAHILSRVIGGGAVHGFKPEVWAEPVELKSDDVILLCSDGLYDLLDDEAIYETIAGLDYAAAPKALIEQANARGGFDNISVALAVVGTPEIPMLTRNAAPVTRVNP
jgi:protein phosphatase